MEVEFLPGILSLLQSSGVSFLDRMNFQGVPEMGCSIGIRGVDTAGTMGGYATLTPHGTVHRGILTTIMSYDLLIPSQVVMPF